MSAVVSLLEFVDEMQLVNAETHTYLNKLTGTFFSINDFEIQEKEGASELLPEWERELFEEYDKVLASDEYIELPSQFDIHEYSIMDDFCFSIADEKTSAEMFRLIKGSGAFRRFKQGLFEHGIENDWYKFKDEAYKQIAIDWLEENDLAYLDEPNKKPTG